MGRVWRYWRYVAMLALKATGRDMKVRFLAFVLILVGAILAAYFLHRSFGVDQLFVYGALVVAAFGLFLWKCITIPPRLHEFQATRREIERTARALDAHWERGCEIFKEASLPVMIPAVWNHNFAVWQKSVMDTLDSYDKGESFMFDTIEFRRKLAVEHLTHDPSGAKEANEWRLVAQLTKLRLIVARAYARAKGSDADVYVEEE